MSFISLPEDKVSVIVEDGEGNKATFALKKVLSKDDINYGFLKVLESTRDMPRRDETITVQQAIEAPQALSLDIVLGLPDGQLAVLERALVSWDLVYPKGHPDYPQPIPLDREMIMRLASDVVDELCRQVRLLNHVMTREETQNLGGNSSGISMPTATSPKS